ncbi:MAG: hypothetical protein HY892_18540 [Deltaproteobacteria bacterium]|nr:hypothetical protein [Deltaproteobacteria bacterium]
MFPVKARVFVGIVYVDQIHKNKAYPGGPVTPWTDRVVRWSLGLIFIYAGGSKLLAPKAFAG